MVIPKTIRNFAAENCVFAVSPKKQSPSSPARKRAEEADGGGSVYLRSQPATAEEEGPRTTGARAENEKCAI
ncbi:MAG: hypothetical protein IKS72_06355, partial [Prevotella sp.]|nr:hypothetical protein [Prevotella sp.]